MIRRGRREQPLFVQTRGLVGALGDVHYGAGPGRHDRGPIENDAPRAGVAALLAVCAVPKTARLMRAFFRWRDLRPELEAILIEAWLHFARHCERECLRHPIAARVECGADAAVRLIGLFFG